ncbi:MAG: hypothetical protein Q8L37_06645 [Candidatus Gottesmanbacteria bacterium]|nr:hypothetical protein [Candidatus Gottesmanbacteria bacterium]
MCNVNPGSCDSPAEWEAGWYEAREPENQNAAPAQPEYTQRNEANDGTAPADGPVQIIRLAGEPNSTNRSQIAADDAKARGGDPVNPSSVTKDAIALDGNLQPIGGAGTGGGSGSGAAACWGIGGGQVERDCLARAAGGVYTSGGCRGMNVAQCAAWAQANGYRSQYCSGNQESAGATRAGEFLSCGKSGTNGCGQIDILDAKGDVMGFIIDKSGCGGNTPTTTTNNAPPREITTTTTTTTTTTINPTPTATPAPTCETIRVYDAGGADITASLKNGSKKLSIGEEVTLATPKGTATKSRFRIQGVADWAENDTTKTTATEYRLGIKIPSALTQTQGTFEVEVFISGVWK